MLALALGRRFVLKRIVELIGASSSRNASRKGQNRNAKCEFWMVRSGQNASLKFGELGQHRQNASLKFVGPVHLNSALNIYGPTRSDALEASANCLRVSVASLNGGHSSPSVFDNRSVNIEAFHSHTGPNSGVARDFRSTVTSWMS